MAADHEPPLENQQMGEDLCIRGESGTDLAQVGRLPQIMVPFINRGACGLVMWLSIGFGLGEAAFWAQAQIVSGWRQVEVHVKIFMGLLSFPLERCGENMENNGVLEARNMSEIQHAN